MVGDALGDALGEALGDALGEFVGDVVGAGGGRGGDAGGLQRADQTYDAAAHAGLAESESSIARLLQSLRSAVPENIEAIPPLVTLPTSKASGWLKL